MSVPEPKSGAAETAHDQSPQGLGGDPEESRVPFFAPYELRHTFATRLIAGGVAHHMMTQMLRQGDAEVFKLYSQAKLGMMREALTKLDR